MSRDRSQPSAECIATDHSSLVEDRLDGHRNAPADGGTGEPGSGHAWITRMCRAGPLGVNECCQMCCRSSQHIYLLYVSRARATRRAKETRPAEGTDWTSLPSAASGLSVALSAAALPFVGRRGSQTPRGTNMHDKPSADCGSGGTI